MVYNHNNVYRVINTFWNVNTICLGMDTWDRDMFDLEFVEPFRDNLNI